MRRFMLVSALLFSATVQAAEMRDLVLPYVGQTVVVANGQVSIDAQLLRVESDHFCAQMQVPEFIHERCYAFTAVNYVSPPAGQRKAWIEVR